ncbi:MAG: hypothetical protein N5P05_002640 [Chroococcopsis gigantea SAG 12.99]|jgi:hypothetical protein|nr:lmo0937 family membrane protein [Chlorogloea purpurea SAG 13.99]MDV3001034.1 hypothetical protein [Chroococcopsis gigantea SAG 12.99]
MLSILWAAVLFLITLWAVGFAFHVFGNLIHILLVAAIVVAIYNFATSRDLRQ